MSYCLCILYYTVPPKSKLPPLVSFLARRVSFLSRRFSFLLRHFSFLLRITEAFSMAYITRKKPVMCNDCCSAVHWQIDGGWDRVTEDTCTSCVMGCGLWVMGENKARFYYIGLNGPDSEKCICS